jgi:hypothetical protein
MQLSVALVEVDMHEVLSSICIVLAFQLHTPTCQVIWPVSYFCELLVFSRTQAVPLNYLVPQMKVTRVVAHCDMLGRDERQRLSQHAMG